MAGVTLLALWALGWSVIARLQRWIDGGRWSTNHVSSGWHRDQMRRELTRGEDGVSWNWDELKGRER